MKHSSLCVERKTVLLGVVFSSLILIGVSLGCATMNIPASSLIRGGYTAVDFASGQIKINDAKMDSSNLTLLFSNKHALTLTVTSFSSTEGESGSMSFGWSKGKNSCNAMYRGHRWKKPVSLTIDEICYDDDGNIFYVKISANINLRDCEKSMLDLNCTNLLIQNDLTYNPYQRSGRSEDVLMLIDELIRRSQR